MHKVWILSVEHCHNFGGCERLVYVWSVMFLPCGDNWEPSIAASSHPSSPSADFAPVHWRTECITGEGEDQLTTVHDKRMAWSDSLKSNKFVRSRDSSLSLNIQLKPWMEWGLVCTSAKLDNADKAIHVVYHASLRRLCVHQRTKKEFHMLPEMYQGLEMFNLNLECLSARFYFLWWHCNMDNPMCQML